jgi:CheY-like chemotaxis protein
MTPWSTKNEGQSDGQERGCASLLEAPVATADRSALDSRPEPAHTESDAVARRARRVLIVDDNISSADSLALIVKLWGHDTRVANSGPEALETAEAYRPEIILLDIGLPGMDGYEVARRIRSSPELSTILLAAMTGYGRDEDRHRAIEAGFDHHLVKPIDLDLLESMLQ